MTATLTDLQEHYGVREWGWYAPLAVRLLRRVVEEEGCWVWTGSTDEKGYSRIREKNRTVAGHRLSYEFFVGPIPAGLQIDHLCRVRPCIRPSHLEPVTNRENSLRGVGPTAQNARRTSCIRGHDFTPENTYTCKRGMRSCIACRRLNQRKAAA